MPLSPASSAFHVPSTSPATEVDVARLVTTMSGNFPLRVEAEVTVGPVYDPAGFAEDPHVKGRGVLVEVEDPEHGPVPMHAPFPRLSRTPARIRRLAPSLGQDEADIAAELDRTEIPR